MATRKKSSAGSKNKRGRKTEANGVAGPAAAAFEEASNPYAQKIQLHITSMLGRLGRQLAKMKAFALPDDGIVEAAQTAYDSFVELNSRLAGVTEDWKPTRGSITTVPVEVGTKVSIKEKFAAKYVDVIDEGADITVAGLVQNQLKLKTTSSGEVTQLIIPRSHVQPLREVEEG